MTFWSKVKSQLLANEVIDPNALRREIGEPDLHFPHHTRASSSLNDADPSKEKNDGIIVDTESVHLEDTPFIDILVSPEELARLQLSRFYKIKKFFWDGADKHPKERAYLMKLDFFLVSSSMLGYFIKNLNQSNVNLAYVNGMSEELKSNELNYMITLWTVGYIIGQIPGNLVLHRVSARYFLGGLEITWAILTLLMITCKNVHGYYAIRFFVGLLEAAYFPSMEYLLGSNYAGPELSTRAAFFAIASGVSGLVSGPLQLAILRRFKNSSMKPYKWMFVFDAVISFPIGIYTMCVDPNTPSTTDAFYFNAQDKLVGLERRRRIGAQLNTREKYTWAKIKSFISTWHVWVFPLLFLAYNNSCAASSQPTFTTWMKISLQAGPEIYNTYPSILTAIGMVLTLIFSYFHNYIGGKHNFYFVALFFILVMVGCSSLSYWNIPRAWHWICYFLNGVPAMWGQPFIFAWVNRLLFHDDMKRNFVVVLTNNLAYVTGAWVPILVWNTDDQPVYHIGFTYTACLCAFGLIMTFIAFYLTKRDERLHKVADAGNDQLLSEDEEKPPIAEIASLVS